MERQRRVGEGYQDRGPCGSGIGMLTLGLGSWGAGEQVLCQVQAVSTQSTCPRMGWYLPGQACPYASGPVNEWGRMVSNATFLIP